MRHVLALKTSMSPKHLTIIDRFIKLFEVDRIEVLTGDREFVGKEWLIGHKMDEFLEMVELFGMYLNRVNFKHRKTSV